MVLDNWAIAQALCFAFPDLLSIYIFFGIVTVTVVH